MALSPEPQDKGVKKLEPNYWVQITSPIPDFNVPNVALGVCPATKLSVTNDQAGNKVSNS